MLLLLRLLNLGLVGLQPIDLKLLGLILMSSIFVSLSGEAWDKASLVSDVVIIS